MRFEIGDVVRLRKDFCKDTGSHPMNSPEFMNGTVNKIDEWIHVTFENGVENGFVERQLRLVKKGNHGN